MLQREVLQAVKKVPIMNVLGQFIDLRKHGVNFRGFCPFHDERTPSFYVHPGKNIYKCFGCGAGGDAIKFITDYKKTSFVEAVQLIEALTNISSKRTQRTQKTTPTSRSGKQQHAQYGTIPLSLLRGSTSDVRSNSLTARIADIVGENVLRDILQVYQITLDAHGFINYPQIDVSGKCRTCKSIQYENGHRTGNFRWSHNSLKSQLPIAFMLKQCFTGEHMISMKPVAIVEGQSTMLFMAALSDAALKYKIKLLQPFSRFTWIATGGADGIGWKDEQVIKALRGKEVVLFPDAGFYDQWQNDAEIMREHGVNVQVSSLIETKYANNQLKFNDDLRDWFMLFADDIRKLCQHGQRMNCIFSREIFSIESEVYTGKDFDHIIIVCFRMKSGKQHDCLFNKNGKTVMPGEQSEAVEQLARFYGKKLVRMYFDDVPCWMHIHT
jgi:hypothetical protein